MSSLDDQLLAGERIVLHARPHWILFAPSLFVVLLGAGTALALQLLLHDYWYIGAALAGLGIVLALPATIRYAGSEYAVTNMRVLARMGLVRRESLETLLSKIEAIGVEQELWGRLLGYGTVTITGTGGTQEAIPNVPRPLEFRRQVQAQIVAREEQRGRGADAAEPAGLEPRIERDCPWCAERILARARVCKHCGRDVEPV